MVASAWRHVRSAERIVKGQQKRAGKKKKKCRRHGGQLTVWSRNVIIGGVVSEHAEHLAQKRVEPVHASRDGVLRHHQRQHAADVERNDEIRTRRVDHRAHMGSVDALGGKRGAQNLARAVQSGQRGARVELELELDGTEMFMFSISRTRARAGLLCLVLGASRDCRQTDEQRKVVNRRHR
jgi:hypothetical protein